MSRSRKYQVMSSMNTPDGATPPVNVYEGNGQLSVAVPIPGAQPEHVSVGLEAERLEVTAECKYPQESQHYLRHDRQVGAWHLEIELPLRIDPSTARATLNLGVLVVMAHVSEAAGAPSRPPVAPIPPGT